MVHLGTLGGINQTVGPLTVGKHGSEFSLGYFGTVGAGAVVLEGSPSRTSTTDWTTIPPTATSTGAIGKVDPIYERVRARSNGIFVGNVEVYYNEAPGQ